MLNPPKPRPHHLFLFLQSNLWLNVEGGGTWAGPVCLTSTHTYNLPHTTGSTQVRLLDESAMGPLSLVSCLCVRQEVKQGPTPGTGSQRVASDRSVAIKYKTPNQ